MCYMIFTANLPTCSDVLYDVRDESSNIRLLTSSDVLYDVDDESSKMF